MHGILQVGGFIFCKNTVEEHHLGRFEKIFINFFLGREAETDDSSRKGLILVWPFVKVARQTYATSAKQKDLDLNSSFMLVLWYRINLLFYSTFPAWLSLCYLAYYYYFNYKFLSRSICLELIAGWTSKVNVSWINSLLFSVFTRSFI